MIAKWVLVLLIFNGHEIVNYEVFFGATEKECQDAKGKADASNKPGDKLFAWADCMQITYVPPKVLGDPATEKRS